MVLSILFLIESYLNSMSETKMKKIILDTNMLLVPSQFKVDVFNEIKEIVEGEIAFIITNSIKRELEKISKSGSKDSPAAKVALDMIEKNDVEIVNAKGKNTDEEIVNLVDKNIIVATNDKLLQKKLKDKGTKIIYLRSKKKLELF